MSVLTATTDSRPQLTSITAVPITIVRKRFCFIAISDRDCVALFGPDFFSTRDGQNCLSFERPAVKRIVQRLAGGRILLKRPLEIRIKDGNVRIRADA